MKNIKLLPVGVKEVFQYGGQRCLIYTTYCTFEAYETDIGLTFIKKKGFWYQIIDEESSFWYDSHRREHGSQRFTV